MLRSRITPGLLPVTPANPLLSTLAPPKQRGASASTAESPPPKPAADTRYKTELCKNFSLTGQCKFGKGCAFAHCKTELRTRQTPHYKARSCVYFNVQGLCPYGPRCQYFHAKTNQEHIDKLDALERRLELIEASQSYRVSLTNLLEAEENAHPRLPVFEQLTKKCLSNFQCY